MRLFFILSLLLLTSFAFGQKNCNVFLYQGDTLQYEACKTARQSGRYYQFSREYQMTHDRALEIYPNYADSYTSKSTAYLKSGDFITWKQLMNKAVSLSPEEHLGYRGWCRYQFFRDYEGAIADIERLDELIDYDIGHSVNSDYHLNIAKAICYKALGQSEKAIQIIETQMRQSDHFVGEYDYFHLGILYLEKGDYQKSIKLLDQQNDHNELADAHYYQAKAYQELGQVELAKQKVAQAKTLYSAGRKAFDGYTHIDDEIDLRDIEEYESALP
ncbi:MAG: hypothetical protein AAGI23_04170 [Bacteroidota bacterium]